MRYAIGITFVYAFLLIFISGASAQSYITGLVADRDGTPLAGAALHWVHAPGGGLTDDNGGFHLALPAQLPDHLVTQVIGYEPDTTVVDGPGGVWRIVLFPPLTTETIEILGHQSATYHDAMATRSVETLTQKEFQKAACCNLAESFQTNASVDVTFPDAVSGMKQIQMLGLSGVYTQITTENLPTIRGLNRVGGLTYIPGVWLNTVRVSKGAGSVANGYEAITGQIDINLKQPHEMEQVLFNTYYNSQQRMEANLVVRQSLNPRWHTAVFLHGSGRQSSIDGNNDGFLDVPKYRQINVANRWKYQGGKGWESEFGAQVVDDDVTGGQTNFQPRTDKGTTNAYGIGIRNRRVEAFSKTGHVSADGKRTFGLQSSWFAHDLNTYFGLRTYDALERQGYLNFIYQAELAERHSVRGGLSFLADEVRESLFVGRAGYWNRTEMVPGAFVEYTWKQGERSTVVLGGRADYHNLYGWWFTPRGHWRYAFDENTTLRIGGGRGRRVPNPLVDNLGMLAAGGLLVRRANLQPEDAWNGGVSLARDWRLRGRKVSLVADVYHTYFVQQLVLDRDFKPDWMIFRNLEGGQSYATSVQVELNAEVLPRLDVKVAYKYYDVRATLGGELRPQPMLPPHRVLVNLAYAVGNWKFDATMHWYGSQRLPSTASMPEEHRLPERAPDFAVFYAQVNRTFGRWEVYVGGENLLGFRQENPIMSADAPFSHFFNTAYVWGPIVRQVGYVGLTWKLP